MRVVLAVLASMFPALALADGGDLTIRFAPGAVGAYAPSTGAGSLDVVVMFGAETPPFGPTPCSGFSLAFANDPLLVAPVGAEPIGVLASINGGAGPEFFAIEIFGDGIAVGCLTSLQGVSTLQFPPDTAVVAVSYAVGGLSLVGSSTGTSTQLTWQTVGTSPPYTNFVLYGDGYAPLVLVSGEFPLLPRSPFRRGDVKWRLDGRHR
ncbi:MAG: hypothetical protein AB7O52_19565 [Planctomycetota bacterium]